MASGFQELAESAPKSRRQKRDLKAHGRSALSNGTITLPETDNRLRSVRRYRDLVRAIVADQGGEDRLSETRRTLIRRFAAGAVFAEQIEAKFAAGEEISSADWAVIASTLVRIAQRIGIDRRAKDITPSLRDVMDAADG